MKQRRRTMFGIGCSVVAGGGAVLLVLTREPASATAPIGSLEDPSKWSEGTSGGSQHGRAPILTGTSAQRQAGSAFDAVARTIGSVQSSDGSIGSDRYYTRPRFTGFPGLCAADAYAVSLQSPQPAIEKRTVYRLIGSTEALGIHGNRFVLGETGKYQEQARQYTARATANCEKRAASDVWFPGNSDGEVWDALHLVDGVIAALRSFRPSRLSIRCNSGNRPACDAAKQSLLSADPTRIAVGAGSELSSNIVHRTTVVDLRDKDPTALRISIHEYYSNRIGSDGKNKVVVHFDERPPPPSPPPVPLSPIPVGRSPD